MQESPNTERQGAQESAQSDAEGCKARRMNLNQGVRSEMAKFLDHGIPTSSNNAVITLKLS